MLTFINTFSPRLLCYYCTALPSHRKVLKGYQITASGTYYGLPVTCKSSPPSVFSNDRIVPTVGGGPVNYWDSGAGTAESPRCGGSAQVCPLVTTEPRETPRLN
ncbi:hypothetical protein J6590_013832 [Homalodisca vitripennis]|nr:hypothetical protein J6590_013832 [Homalodisca vitripennis]